MKLLLFIIKRYKCDYVEEFTQSFGGAQPRCLFMWSLRLRLLVNPCKKISTFWLALNLLPHSSHS